jgi:hypothetical protein
VEKARKEKIASLRSFDFAQDDGGEERQKKMLGKRSGFFAKL